MDKAIGNELLGEFLGYQKAHFKEDKDELQFDTDWNDLIHVVKKCFSQSLPSKLYEELTESLLSLDKATVWTTCIKIVQHVNKQK